MTGSLLNTMEVSSSINCAASNLQTSGVSIVHFQNFPMGNRLESTFCKEYLEFVTK